MSILGILDGLNAQSVQGLWKETYWGPMTSYYYFDTLTSSFKFYYHDDTHGSFGKGSFKIHGNKITLDYDSIECDKLIIERLDDDLLTDSTMIAFFHYWGFPKKIDLISNGQLLYSNWTKSSDSIIEDYLFIKVPTKLDKIEIEIFDQDGLNERLVKSFSCRLYEKPFINIYYYPCKSWYSYETPKEHVMKIRWKDSDYFDIRGTKYKFGFKKLK